jgi:hypothetical protein
MLARNDGILPRYHFVGVQPAALPASQKQSAETNRRPLLSHLRESRASALRQRVNHAAPRVCCIGP